MPNLDARVAELAARYRPLAAEMLAEVIRIPADFVDKPADQGGDPRCGLSNHEFPRLEYLRKKIIEIKAVRRPEDVFFDDFGNLVWVVTDPDDGVAPDQKKVIYLDGHSDTVRALRPQWREKIGGGIDAYDGLVDAKKVNREFLKKQLGWLPPDSEWIWRALNTMLSVGMAPASNICVQRYENHPLRTTSTFLPWASWRATASMA